MLPYLSIGCHGNGKRKLSINLSDRRVDIGGGARMSLSPRADGAQIDGVFYCKRGGKVKTTKWPCSVLRGIADRCHYAESHLSPSEITSDLEIA